MATDCIPQVSFEFQGLPQPIIARFDQAHASSDGGAILLKALDDRLGLTRQLAASLTDRRTRQGPARADRVGAAARVRDRLRLRRLQRRRPVGRGSDPQAPARARSARRAGAGLPADALPLRERRGLAGAVPGGASPSRIWSSNTIARGSRAGLGGSRSTSIPTDDPTHGQQDFHLQVAWRLFTALRIIQARAARPLRGCRGRPRRRHVGVSFVHCGVDGGALLS